MPEAEESTPPLSLKTDKHNLPVQLTPLIGREMEVKAVCSLLQQTAVRLLTLTGTGGIGKTRLALQVASELLSSFADGVYFVPLVSISDASLVVPTIAQALGIREAGDWPLQERLHTYLHEKQVLLLIDNFEQVTDAAPLLTAFIAHSPQLKIVVTSRAVLHVSGEQEFAVAPLALPDPKAVAKNENVAQYAAIELFLQRARMIKPDFTITTANAQAVAEICLRLDGLPLALELAAARIKLLAPQALLKRLEYRLPMLTSTARDIPERQRTLRNALAWSYDLLDNQEQRLFRQLSVFVGGFTLEAAESICQTAHDSAVSILDGVTSLIDKSLLYQTEQTEHEPRLVMLETIREYAQECLFASEEADAIHYAHAAYYLALAEEVEPQLSNAGQKMVLLLLEHAYDNLRAALHWLLKHRDFEMVLRLSGALWRFWWMRGRVTEGCTLLEQALTSSHDSSGTVRAKALNAAGTLAALQGNFEHAEELCREGLALLQSLQDTHGMVASLWTLGYIAREKGNYVTASMLLAKALDLARQDHYTTGIAYTLEVMAAMAFDQGHYAEARMLVEESLKVSKNVGDTWGIARSNWLLALVILCLGDLSTATAQLEESLVLFKEVDDKRGIAYGLTMSGYAAFFQGRHDATHVLLTESLALHKEMGDRRGIAWTLLGLGWAALMHHDTTTAHQHFEHSLSLLRELDQKWFMCLVLEGLACCASEQAQPILATRLWGAAEALREAIGAILSPIITTLLYANFMSTTRTHLGENAFNKAWAEGRHMVVNATFDDALFALHEPTAKPEPPPRNATTYPAGLTAREVDVLRWVAKGLTDIQVAEQLIISPRTVSTHLSSIYGKLGVTTRSAATRFAVEHQLT